jgi:hypothetical protein
VPREYRQTVLAGLADALAAQGFQVDPQAPLRARVTQASHQRIKLGHQSFHTLLVRVVFVDATGNEIYQYAELSADAAGRADMVWEALAKDMQRIKLPRLLLTDEKRQEMHPWDKVLQPGVDGLFGPGEVAGVNLAYQ